MCCVIPDGGQSGKLWLWESGEEPEGPDLRDFLFFNSWLALHGSQDDDWPDLSEISRLENIWIVSTSSSDTKLLVTFSQVGWHVMLLFDFLELCFLECFIILSSFWFCILWHNYYNFCTYQYSTTITSLKPFNITQLSNLEMKECTTFLSPSHLHSCGALPSYWGWYYYGWRVRPGRWSPNMKENRFRIRCGLSWREISDMDSDSRLSYSSEFLPTKIMFHHIQQTIVPSNSADKGNLNSVKVWSAL